MKNVYVVADNIYSPLGETTRLNMEALKLGRSGILEHLADFSSEPFYASLLPTENKEPDKTLTAFEQIVFSSAFLALKESGLEPDGPKTGFILSTTKGNIGLIENLHGRQVPEARISLNSSAEIIAKKLGIVNAPLVVSHACISGLLAMITGMRLIQSGIYDQIIISGADLITSFIYSGFKSFQAISPLPCKPFDAARDGITLGEAAATVILSAHRKPGAVLLLSGAVSNDANHISGPSRTGEELFFAIRSALHQSGKKADEIDFISAHGTATRYNDEMEASAFNLSRLQETPMNSLKGYFGHTLGAAGILESVISIQSMKENIILPSKGFANPGTEKPVHVVKDLTAMNLKTCLKTASGFGGCNAAIVLAVI